AVGVRDLAEIVILAVAIYAIVRFLNKTRGSGMIRALALIVVGLFLVAQVIISFLNLVELGKGFDYLLRTVVTAMAVIFRPELARGLMVLGRSRVLRYFVVESYPLADKLADAAEGLSRECIGALVAIQRQADLEPYVETGERIDGEVSSA